MAEYKLEFSGTTVPYSEHSRVLQLQDDNKVFVIGNNTLYEFKFSNDSQPAITTSKDRVYPFENAKLLHVEPIDDDQTAIIVKVTQGIRIYLHSKDTFQLASEDDQFHDAFHWYKPSNAIHFGHFYNDSSILGMMTSHTDIGTKFYAIFKDVLLAGEFPIYPLDTNEEIFEDHSPNSTVRMLADLNRGPKNAIVSRNHDGLSAFEFNERNGIDFMMKIPYGGTTLYDEGIFFADLTHEKFNDMVHFNSSGMFVYQYDEDYKFIHYNPLFSEEKGWTKDHTKTIRLADIDRDGFIDMVFTGPKGIAAITFNKYENLWTPLISTSNLPPNMRHAQIMHVAEDLPNGCYIFTHLYESIYWAKVIPAAISPPQIVDTLSPPSKVLIKSSMTPLLTNTPKSFKPMPLLRDMNIWSDIVNCVRPNIGKPMFSIPLVNLPDPALKLMINYDATSPTNEILGIGWSMPLNLIAMDDHGSVFEEDVVFVIAFQDSTQALKYLPKESNSVVRTYTLLSKNDDLKFRAKFYTNDDQWVVDLGNGIKQFFGQIQSTGAVAKDVVWKNWHGAGFDSANQMERSRMWYLAKVQDERGYSVLEFFYDIDNEIVNSGLKYTKGVYIKKSRDYKGNEIEFRYKEKDASEYKTYSVQDQEGNYNWEPVQTRYLASYTFSAPSGGRQEIQFKYRAYNGLRFLEEIRQSNDIIDSPVAKFEYLIFPKRKYSLKYVHLPYDVKVEFSYTAVGDSKLSNELRRIDIPSEYVVTTGDDYLLVSFINSKDTGQLVMRMFNQDMTKEFYTSDPRVKVTDKGRWPLLGEYGSVVGHNVIRGDHFFGVVFYYVASKHLCLFGRESDEWFKSDCHEFGESATMQAGEDFCLVTDPGSKVELFEWKPLNKVWFRKTIVSKADRVTSAVHKNKFVIYDNKKLSLGYKTRDGTWHHKPLADLYNCLSGTENILRRFNLKEDNYKLISATFHNNALKFNHNLIALNCLEIDDGQLQTSIKLYTIDRLKNVTDHQVIVINQENLHTFISNEEKDPDGNYYKFKYHIKQNGDFYIKVADMRGKIMENLRENHALSQRSEVEKHIEKLINSPARRLLINVSNYLMSFSDKMIVCYDQKLTFGGNQWKRTTLTDEERKHEKFSINLGDRFILEKTNKEASIKLLKKQTKELLSDLSVNMTDVRIFYPVYIATQAQGMPIHLVEFDETNVMEEKLSRSETLSPHTNSLMLITEDGVDTKTVIFRQQYGMKNFLPNHVVCQVAVVFDNDRKKRLTGYEYDANSAKLMGNTVVYSKFSLIPANEKYSFGWLEQFLNNGTSIAYDNQGEIVRYIPSQKETSNDEEETEEVKAFRIATTIFDKSGKLEIAQCAPFRLTDETVGYYGFEDYEVNTIGSSKKWNFETSNVIRNGFALTGKSYLHQELEPIEGIFQPADQNSEYIVSSWVRLQNVTEIPQIGQVTPHLRAIILTSSGNEVISLLSEIKFQLDDWIYLELVVDLPFARKTIDGEPENNLQIAIRVGPTLTTQIDIDHIRFAPLIADFNMNVFDATTHLNTVVIQSTGSILRSTYDVYNTVVGKINEENQIEELTVHTKAGKVPIARCTIKIVPEMGFYEQFAPFAFANRWKIIKTNPWRIASYQLEHHSDERNSLELITQDIASDSYGFRVLYSLSGDHAELVINDSLELSKHLSDCKLRDKPIPSDGEILVVKEKDRFAIWIDGSLYADQSLEAFNKPLKFTMAGRVSLKDMMVFSKAIVKVVYQNGFDEPTQEISLESADSIVVQEKLYDELGRQRITTQHVRIVRSKFEPLFAYIPNFVDQSNSIWNTGLLDGLAAKILGHPYGFTETRYEKNPLNEKTLVALPGKDFSSSGIFSKQFSSKTNNLFVKNRYPLSANVSYQVELKLGGIEDVTVLNSENKKIAHYVHVPGSKDLFSTYKLNDDGNLLQSLPPLYYERIGIFHKTNADLLKINQKDLRLQKKLGVHIDYDRSGKPIRKTTPDAGPIENVYDDDKFLRFVLFYSYAIPDLVETITYFTYDPLGRLLSTGKLTDTKVPKDQMLKLTLNQSNSLEYQSFNYANFERDPTLRGRLLRSITMNGYEPFAEVMYVNERGDALEKQIILPNITNEPDAIAISKKYLAGRLSVISYPAQFLGQPFSVVYGYNKLGRINSIGTPDDPSKFMKISHNAAGQINEETYEPASVYNFKQVRDYNEPGFLARIRNPFQTEEISYTESSYGGTNRGDGSVTRLKFSAKWDGLASSVGVGLSPDAFVNDFMSPEDSNTCFEALKTAGYLDHKNRQIIAFYPDLEIDFPIICTLGTTGRHISRVLGRYGFPREHGYRIDYGAHQELTKAKYFIGSDEPEPFQPDTFAKEISRIGPAISQRIWNILKAAQFLIEDPDRTNISTSHGKESRKNYIGSKLFTHLKEINPEYVTYAGPLRKLFSLRYCRRQMNVTLFQMQDFIRKWLGNSSTTFVERTAADIFEMLRQKRYFLNPLDGEFQNVLKEFEEYFPEIVCVLFKYFGKQLGRSEFDVESYEIDANGNHRMFNTGYDHYELKYEADSNRVEGVQYKSFESPRPEEVFPIMHDSRGNVIQALHKGIKLMEYHPVSNLLQRATMVNGDSVEFYYDSKGERVLKRFTKSDGKMQKEVHYLRDDQGRTLVERELSYITGNQPPAVLVTMYIYGARGLVGFVKRDQFYSVITDHQGSVRLIVRDGEVVAAYDYLPYGSFMRIFGADPEAHIPYRYTGQEWDQEIGLYNYHARFYDPSIGRFYQIDPKEQYFSPYKYAGNSPVSMIDPSGEVAFLAIAFMFIGAYLGGAAANGTFNFTKWKLNVQTVLGIAFGALSGYFLPGGFASSIAFIGLGKTIGTGVAMAYFSAAAANDDWFFWNWDFSSPRTISALFDGFSMGVTMFGNFRNIGRFYKELSAGGKLLFIGTTSITGTGLVLMGGFATDWDLKRPQFWFAIISAVASAPELTIFGARAFKSTKQGWISLKDNMQKAWSNYDDYVGTFFAVKGSGRSVKAALVEIYKGNRELGGIAKIAANGAGVGISAFLVASALNEGFFNWNMTSVSTYQNLITAFQVGGQLGRTGTHGVKTLAKKLQLKKANKALKLTDQIARISSRLYQKVIETTVIERNLEHYNAKTKTQLQKNLIPNTAMSVMVVDKIVMVGFSSNNAPGIYLVYDHNHLTTPSLKAAHIVHNNGVLGENIVRIRNDPTLADKIARAVQEVQNGIKQFNIRTYDSQNLRGNLIERSNQDRSVDIHVRRQFVTAIHNEILRNGYVDKEFIRRQFREINFQNQAIREINEQVLQASTNAEHAQTQASRDRLMREYNRLRKTQEKVIDVQQREFVDRLFEPVKELKNRLTPWSITNCAEAHTMLALERQRNMFGLEYYKPRYYDIQLDIRYMSTYKTQGMPDRVTGFQRCDNCMVSTSKVRNVLTDTDWMDTLDQSVKSANARMVSSAKKLQFLVPIINLQKTVKQEEERGRQKRSAWYKRPLKWFNGIRNNTIKTIVEFGDEFLSKMDVNSTLLLTDVILAKCQRRRLHQVSSDTRQLNDAELLCNLLQLFEEGIAEAAELSGTSISDINIDTFTMQKEVMPLLRKRQFDRINKIMLNYAITGLGSEVTQKTIDSFRLAFESLKLNHATAEMYVRMEQAPRDGGFVDMPYSGNVRQEYNSSSFDTLDALSYDHTFLN